MICKTKFSIIQFRFYICLESMTWSNGELEHKCCAREHKVQSTDLSARFIYVLWLLTVNPCSWVQENVWKMLIHVQICAYDFFFFFPIIHHNDLRSQKVVKWNCPKILIIISGKCIYFLTDSSRSHDLSF